MTRLFAPLLVLLTGILAAKADTKPSNQAAAASTSGEPNLPLILLDAKEPIDGDRRVACTVRIIMPAGMTSPTGTLSGVVHIHGGVSRGYAKKSYGLALATPVQWLGMRNSAHWVLNAAFIDRSLMRHKLSYDLFHSLATADAKRYAAESRFVEVHLDGKYNGAYLLMERVDRALLELCHYESNAASHACIYKAVDHSANFSQPGHAGYEQREPDAATNPYWSPLDRFDRFVSQTSDAEF